MKIFNIQPITVTEYAINKAYLTKSFENYCYESGFAFTSAIENSLYTMTIEFDISSSLGRDSDKLVISSNNSEKYNIMVNIESDKDTFLSYNSHSKFNFESEGFDADVLALISFLEAYDLHTKTFFLQHGLLSIQEIQEKKRIHHTLKADAFAAIESLRANNMYEF